MSDQPEFIPMRRSDRAIEDETWIAEFLQQVPFGVTASVVDGLPHVNTNLFAYDPQRHAIYYHSSSEGRTYAAIHTGTMVAFTAARMGHILPAPAARGFSVEYESVVAYGQAQAVSEAQEMVHGLQLVMDKYAAHLEPGRDYRAPDADQLSGVAVYRLDISRWSAKRRPPKPDAEGAYTFPDKQG